MKINTTIIRTAKLVFSILLVLVIYRYFFHFSQLNSVLHLLRNTSLVVYLAAIAACCVNWGIESWKWRQLALPLEALSIQRSVYSTLAGAAVANVVPFRMGEYLGRMIYFKPENRIPAAFNSILGSSTQLMVSLVFGIPAAAIMLPSKYQYLLWFAFAAALAIPLILFMVFRYFGSHNPNRYNWLVRLTSDIRKFTLKQIFSISLLSLMRYLVFGLFYVWLILQFAPSLGFEKTAAGVATVYLLQSFAPSMVITDAGLRTGLPLFVFQVSGSLESPILTAALINYAFNILLPSLAGLFFITATKIKTK